MQEHKSVFDLIFIASSYFSDNKNIRTNIFNTKKLEKVVFLYDILRHMLKKDF